MKGDHRLNPEDVFHLSIYFSGRVQGVGFRYQTLQIAKGFDVTGFVRNLPDGRVELEAEGEEEEVCAFADEIEEQLSAYIRRVEKKSGKGKPRFFNFTIQ